VSERGQIGGSNWDKINFAADASGVLLGLLMTGDEEKAQERLNQMSLDQLTTFENWTGVLDTLVHYTRRRKFHESREGETP
jgi:hypothetical protein